MREKMQIMRPPSFPVLSRFCSILALGLWSLCVVRSDVPGAVEPLQGLLDGMMRNATRDLTQRPVKRTGFLDTYDLTIATDEAMRKITSDAQFSAYVDQRKASLSPEQLKAADGEVSRWEIEYAETNAAVKPDVQAWLCLRARFEPWDRALAAYHRLVEHRPGDFVPAWALAMKILNPVDPPTPEQWKDLIESMRQAVPRATNAEQLMVCVGAVGTGALKLNETGNGKPVPMQMIWEWMRDVPLPEAAKDPRDALSFNLVKLMVAAGAKDFMAAVELAPRCRMRIFQPMYLVFAGKRPEAYESLHRLRQERTLSPAEEAGLRKLEPTILTLTQHFEEAWRSIGEQRARPNLTIQDSEWLDLTEKLLRKYETAVRNQELQPSK
jgi:hypothetical protein